MKKCTPNDVGVYLAIMETENYTWKAVGRSYDEAMNAIADCWNYGPGNECREKMSRNDLENYYSIYCEFLDYGIAKYN